METYIQGAAILFWKIYQSTQVLFNQGVSVPWYVEESSSDGGSRDFILKQQNWFKKKAKLASQKR